MKEYEAIYTIYLGPKDWPTPSFSKYDWEELINKWQGKRKKLEHRFIGYSDEYALKEAEEYRKTLEGQSFQVGSQLSFGLLAILDRLSEIRIIKFDREKHIRSLIKDKVTVVRKVTNL